MDELLKQAIFAVFGSNQKLTPYINAIQAVMQNGPQYTEAGKIIGSLIADCVETTLTTYHELQGDVTRAIGIPNSPSVEAVLNEYYKLQPPRKTSKK